MDPMTTMAVIGGVQALSGGLAAVGSLRDGKAAAADIKAQQRQERVAAGREMVDTDILARRKAAAARANAAAGGGSAAAIVGQALFESNLGQRRVGDDFVTAHRALSVRGAHVKSAAKTRAFGSILAGGGAAAGSYAQGQMFTAQMNRPA